MVLHDAVAEIDRIRRWNYAILIGFRSNEKQLYKTEKERLQSMDLTATRLESGVLQIQPDEHFISSGNPDERQKSQYGVRPADIPSMLEECNKLIGAMLYKTRDLIYSNGCYTEIMMALKSAFNQINRKIEHHAAQKYHLQMSDRHLEIPLCENQLNHTVALHEEVEGLIARVYTGKLPTPFYKCPKGMKGM
jgi:hypothetical protein